MNMPRFPAVVTTSGAWITRYLIAQGVMKGAAFLQTFIEYPPSQRVGELQHRPDSPADRPEDRRIS